MSHNSFAPVSLLLYLEIFLPRAASSGLEPLSFILILSLFTGMICTTLTKSHLQAMEDAHAIALKLDEEEDSNTFFAVYDGHGGGS